MAAPKKKAVRSSASRADAVSLLKADHRQVEGWFKESEGTTSNAKKAKLAQQICAAVTVHTQIGEEIAYPVFIEATGEEDIHHEAVVEHKSARSPLAETEASSLEDDYSDAKVKVLSEMIKHHVKEEEQPGDMFAKARKSEMDLSVLGQQVAARKEQLTSKNPERRGLKGIFTKAVSLAEGR